MLSRRLLLCALLLSLLACNRNNKKVIAVIPKGTSHLFWVSVQAGALAAGEKYGVDVQWNGPAQETEYDRQIQIVDSMIARRVDGLAVAATERKALVRSIDRAAELGIPYQNRINLFLRDCAIEKRRPVIHWPREAPTERPAAARKG